MPGEAWAARARRLTVVDTIVPGRVARSTPGLARKRLERPGPPELGASRLLTQLCRDGSPSSVEGAALEMP